ncbi:hypothetical protein JCM6882_003820 [Rhodosporidiobolus microsporus]
MARPAQVDQLLIAAGSSRNAAQDCRTSDGLVAFASGHSTALWRSADETSHGVYQTLPGHQGDVSALKFAHDGKGTGEKTSRVFASGDSKGVVRVWNEVDGQWSTLAVLSGHTGSVASIEVLELPSESGEGELLVVSGGSDSLLQAWRISVAGAAELVQKVDLKGKIPLEIALSYLPSSSGVVLAVGATETRIQLYSSASASQPDFRKSLSLEGHSDWVRCLSFTTPLPSSASPSSPAPSGYDVSPGEVLLASGSQDNYIRLWRFSRVSVSSPSATPAASTPSSDPPKSGFDAQLDELEKTLAESSTGGAGGEEELRVKAHDFTVGGEVFSCASEAVLLGHDAWVTGLNFAPLSRPSSPSSASTSSAPLPLQLLSTSADRSLILWTPLPTGTILDPSAAPAASTSYFKTSSAHSSFVWTSTRRFGEFTSPTNLGFFGALWGLNGRAVLACGWGGSWHVWRRTDNDEGGGDEVMDEWEPQVATSGHFGQVKQVMWEPEKGEYLLSCCAGDMSTRLWAPWRREGLETWHELARPQIHGYPLTSLTFTARNNRLQFVSGADEKIVRVFDAPGVFLQSLSKLSGIEFGEGAEEGRPMAANVPPLGLSNRAIANADDAAQLAPASSDPFDAVAPVDFNVAPHPPLEEQLLGSTLWPETEKLYGHSFELVAVASAHTTPLIATACKATLPDHAVIRLYNTDTWRPVGDVLTGHALTITRLAFSSGEEDLTRDRWLLSVGRDRTWRIYERDEGKGVGFYRPLADAPKAHSRIIWDACWAADSSFFATASRDKTVKIWTSSPPAASSSSWSWSSTLKFAEAATSVAATLVSTPEGGAQHALAVGLENGEVRVFTSSAVEGGAAEWEERAMLDSSIAHVLTVSTLSFCPSSRQLPPGVVRLATGSEDRSVRVFDIQL